MAESNLAKLATVGVSCFALGVMVSLVAGRLLGSDTLPEDDMSFEDLPEEEDSEASSCASMGDCKLVLVVRMDLKMGKGKIAAQCAHAAVKAYKSTAKKDPELLEDWLYSGQPKVVLKAPDEKALMEIMDIARAAHVGAHIIADAGRTQIAPGSITVLGVGPAPADIVDQITGNLKLL